MSAWCEPGKHSVPDREAELIRYDTLPGGVKVPVNACGTHVRDLGLVPRLDSGAAFVGHRDRPPTPPGPSA
jgi:hypothetical protein